MPLNAFRSFFDAHPFKGRSTETAISNMRLNYALLAEAYLRLPYPADRTVFGYGHRQRSIDLRALDRLLFIYYADRLRALIEDAVRVFLEDVPQRAFRVAPSHPAWKNSVATVEDIRPAMEEAGTKATRGSYSQVADFISRTFSVAMFSPTELTYLTYVAETRNLIVHRGEIVDLRFVEKSGSAQTVGEEVRLPSVRRIAMQAISLPARVAARLDGRKPYVR